MSFSQKLRKLTEARKQDLHTVARGSLLELGNFMIALSPVDTARFLNNWNITLDAIDPSVKPPAKTKSSRASVENRVSGKLAAKIESINMGQMFYMTNNLPYAKPIEYGHSQQAPSGVVRVSVDNWNRFVDEEIAKVKK